MTTNEIISKGIHDESFVDEVEQALYEAGVSEVDWFYEESPKYDVFEDDGSIHFQNGHVRVCAYIGQDVSMHRFITTAQKAMDAMGVSSEMKANALYS